jgi:clathrin heavy chain
MALILPYLKTIQHENNNLVNEAINEIYLEEEDYEGLRNSIMNYENFDGNKLVKLLEKHEVANNVNVINLFHVRSVNF